MSGARRRAIVLIAAAVAAASMLVLAFGGGGASARLTPKVVQVKDDVFTPVKVGLVRNHSVRWKWVNTIHTHNVRLTSAPAGVKKANFRSQNSSSPTYTFTRKFIKPGKYHFICSIHPTKMQVNVNVHK